MRHLLSRALSWGVAASTAGCAIVSSEHVAYGSTSASEGLAYALPMARTRLTLSASEGQIILRVAAPQLVADPAHHYIVRRENNPFSSDQVTVTVDPRTGFLLSISAVGKDDTLGVLEKLLLPKKEATPEAFEATGEELYVTELNPADPAELATEAAELNRALTAFLDAETRDCRRDRRVCAEYGAIRQRAPVIRLYGEMAVQARPASADANAVGHAAPDCRIGVCYRQPLPFTLRVALGDARRSVRMNIPNASPLIAVALERHAFVTTTHTLLFEQGTLKSATVDRPSSALALASSPLAVVSGLIGSITKPLSELLKIDTSGQYQAKTEETKVKSENAKVVAAQNAEDAAQENAPTDKLLVTLTLGQSYNTPGPDGSSTVNPAARAPRMGDAALPPPALSTPGSSGTAGSR